MVVLEGDYVEVAGLGRCRLRFEGKGRYRPYLEAIPTHVITASVPALIGLRKVLGYR